MNTPTQFDIIHYIVGLITSIGVAFAFFIAYRHTRLVGFRLLYLAGVAALALTVFQFVATPFLARFLSMQAVGQCFIAFRYVGLAITAVQIAAFVILVRQFLASNRFNTIPQNA